MRLADHADYRITLHRGGSGSDKLLVTFGGQPSGISDSGFGSEFAALNGWDSIHVAQRFGSQYQGLPLDAFFDAVAPVTDGRDVICYGSSLGGYAALYYGGGLDARIIAAAPMLPAWRPLGLRFYEDLPITHHALAQGPLSRHSPVVAFDPMVPNDLHLVREMIQPAYPAARLVELPYAGHTVLVALQRARLLKPFIMGIIERDEVIPLDMPTETSATWHTERGKHLRRTDPDTARRHFEAAMRIEPNPHASSLLLLTLIRLGDHGAAQRLIDRAEASGNRQLRFNASAAAQAREAGLRMAGEG